MKKNLVLFLALSTLIFTSCSKDDDNITSFTKEQLSGLWQLSDVVRPDGKKGDDLKGLEKEAIECQRNHFKLGFKDKIMYLFIVTPTLNGDYLDCGSNYNTSEGKFKVIGNTISLYDEDAKNYIDAFVILSLTKNLLTIKYAKELKDAAIAEYYQNTGSYEYISDYSIKDAMNSKLILKKTENSDE